MEAAKGAVLALLRDAYQRRDLVSLISFRGDTAEVLLSPTGSVEVARARLGELPTGGRTPLAAGLRAALKVASSPARSASHTPLLVVITDGRATAAPAGADPVVAATAAAAEVGRSGIASVVIDVEGMGGPGGPPRLGLAADLASVMGGRHIPVAELTAELVEGTVLMLRSPQR
jgi:magnesium chelatase subunit D